MERKVIAGIASGMLLLGVGAGFGIYTALGGGTQKVGSTAPLVEVTAGAARAGATPSITPEADAPAQTCTYGESGQEVQATLVSSAYVDAPTCSAFAQQLSQADGGFWQVQSPDSSLSTVCVMTSGNALVLTVRDGGGEVLGQGLCAGLQQNGWVEDPEAEQQDAQAQASASAASAAAAASASAQAAASASYSAAVQQADQQFSADLGTLQEDSGNLPGDVKQVQGDVSQTASDLVQEKSDAAQGGGENCTNASTTVYNDAATTIYNDEQTALYNDVNTVARDVVAVRKDVQDVQADAQALQQLGSPVPSDPSSAEAQGTQAVSSAITTTNAAIDQEAGIVSQAYSIADGMATGSCSSASTPGKPPAPVAHLS